jgi:dihydrodipicolinate synthase/N-acetylneuraminate lyase
MAASANGTSPSIRTETIEQTRPAFMRFLRASLTLEERMMIAELWVHECKRLGMRTVVHVSHMCLRTARDLALHAAKIGADSIGMYPPFAPESPPNLAAVVRSIDFATRDVELPL